MRKKILFDPIEFKAAMFGLTEEDIGRATLLICDELEGNTITEDDVPGALRQKYIFDKDGTAHSKYLAGFMPKKRERVKTFREKTPDGYYQESLQGIKS